MGPLLQILLFLSLFLYWITVSKHYIHMLQLSGYKTGFFLTWLSGSLKKEWSLPILLLILLSLFSLVNERVGLPLLSLTLLLQAFWGRGRKKAKKPLVYTTRAIRLFITNYALITLIFLLFYRYTTQPVALPVLLLLLIRPLYFLLVNSINIPTEKAIQTAYYYDAKRVLRRHKNLKIIAITGSFGKTSTKYYLGELLCCRYNTLITPQSYNTPMGIAKTVRKELKATHEYFVVEMGAERRGEIKRLCRFVEPDYGIITSIGPQHLSTFKTMENIINTKFELARYIREKGGALFLNYSDKIISSKEVNGNTITYGIGESHRFNYSAEEIVVTHRGSQFQLVNESCKTALSTKLLGEHNILNITAAIAAANYMGIEIEKLAVTVQQLVPAPHRLELIQRGNITIIDNTYNSNPVGAKKGLEILSCFNEFKILMTPGMVELGEREQELNRELGREAAAVCDSIILIGSSRTLPIKEGIIESGFSEDQLTVVESLDEGMEKISTFSKRKCVVLMENDLPDNY